MSGSGRQAGANTPSAAQGRGAPQGQRGFVREVESKVRRPFENDVAMMMYGFGDVRTPLPESIAILEDIVCDFLTRMTKEACKLSSKRGKKLALEDIYLLVRKHPQMYYRARELNRLDKSIRNAKSMDKQEVKQMGAA